jgi:hypothetical protein
VSDAAAALPQESLAALLDLLSGMKESERDGGVPPTAN